MQVSQASELGNREVIRPAASLIVTRDTTRGVQVLALKRSQAMRFLPGHLAFPGGAVDADDAGVAQTCLYGRIAAQGHPDDAIYAVAALRECAEETGLFCALRDAVGEPIQPILSVTEQMALLSTERNFAAVLHNKGACIAGEALRFVGRWVTPASMPVRFDTRFFLYAWQTVDPVDQGVAEQFVAHAENDWVKWMYPEDLLVAIEQGRERAKAPTIAMLQALSTFSTVAACQAHLCVPGPTRV